MYSHSSQNNSNKYPIIFKDTPNFAYLKNWASIIWLSFNIYHSCIGYDWLNLKLLCLTTFYLINCTFFNFLTIDSLKILGLLWKFKYISVVCLAILWSEERGDKIRRVSCTSVCFGGLIILIQSIIDLLSDEERVWRFGVFGADTWYEGFTKIKLYCLSALCIVRWIIYLLLIWLFCLQIDQRENFTSIMKCAGSVKWGWSGLRKVRQS